MSQFVSGFFLESVSQSVSLSGTVLQMEEQKRDRPSERGGKKEEEKEKGNSNFLWEMVIRRSRLGWPGGDPSKELRSLQQHKTVHIRNKGFRD